MNYSTIIMIAILALVIYIVYTYVYMTSIIINKPIDLKVSKQMSYDAAKMKQPGSTRYYYECWLYIDYNFPTDKEHVIFNRGAYLIVILTGSELSIWEGGEVPNTGLYVKQPKDPNNPNNQKAGTVNGTKILTLSTSFPFQKWVQIVISVDGATIDAYLDGKLVKTVTNKRLGTDNTTPITAGNSYTIGKMNQFSYWPNTIDPQTVWNKYIQGNGQYGISSYFKQYKVDMALSKKNEELYNFSLL